MKCSKCFNEVPDGSKTCPICGGIFADFFGDINLTKKQKVILFVHRMLFFLAIVLFVTCILTIKYVKYRVKMDSITDVNDLVLDKTQKSYINDLYISDERYYKYLLDEKEQELYDEMVSKVVNFDEYIEIDTSKFSESTSEFNIKVLKKIKQAIAMDHPELINFSTMVQVDNSNVYKLHILYTMNKDSYVSSIDEFESIVQGVISETSDLDFYGKLLYVHDFLNGFVSGGSSLSMNTASCLLDSSCNSEGLAKAAQIIFQRLKINSMLVTGRLGNKYHEWNIVKIDNEYYYYDQTSDKILFNDKNYELYNKKLFPRINGKKYSK